MMHCPINIRLELFDETEGLSVPSVCYLREVCVWGGGVGGHDRVLARSKRDGTRAETRFGLSAKRTSPFELTGMSVQSTAGSRGVRISGQRLYRPCSDVQCKSAGYPLHSHLSPSLPLPCVALCHQVPNALCVKHFRVCCEI